MCQNIRTLPLILMLGSTYKDVPNSFFDTKTHSAEAAKLATAHKAMKYFFTVATPCICFHYKNG
jgi:hypothetical protein